MGKKYVCINVHVCKQVNVNNDRISSFSLNKLEANKGTPGKAVYWEQAYKMFSKSQNVLRRETEAVKKRKDN